LALETQVVFDFVVMDYRQIAVGFEAGGSGELAARVGNFLRGTKVIQMVMKNFLILHYG
jgi:hypothetical protein